MAVIDVTKLKDTEQKIPDTVIASIDKNINDIKAENEMVASAEGDILKRQNEAIKYENKLKRKYGLDELGNQIAGINADINREKKLGLAQQQAVQSELEGTGVTQSFVNRRVNRVDRDSAVRQLVLSAKSDALANQYNIARQKITDAVNAKFGNLEAEYDGRMVGLKELKKLYDNNLVKLDRAEKKKLDYELKNIERKKKEVQEIRDLALSMAENNAPASAVEKVLNSDSVNDAIIFATPYLHSSYLSEEDIGKSEYDALKSAALRAGENGDDVSALDYIEGALNVKFDDANAKDELTLKELMKRGVETAGIAIDTLKRRIKARKIMRDIENDRLVLATEARARGFDDKVVDEIMSARTPDEMVNAFKKGGKEVVDNEELINKYLK